MDLCNVRKTTFTTLWHKSMMSPLIMVNTFLQITKKSMKVIVLHQNIRGIQNQGNIHKTAYPAEL